MKFLAIKRFFGKIEHNFKNFLVKYANADKSYPLSDILVSWKKGIINFIYNVFTTGLFVGFVVFCFLIKFNNQYLTFIFRVIGFGVGWILFEKVFDRFIKPLFPLSHISIEVKKK